MKILFLLSLAFFNFNFGNCKIQSASDVELIELIRNNDKVVVLFVKKDCDECEKYESVVKNLLNDFKKHLNAEVFIAANSQMAVLFSPTKEPALIYFRRGLPLLYHGPLSEESIINIFVQNSEPIVKELSDENFEHLTQAATGATTGDWFIFFYSTDCISCQRIHATWEAVGAALKRNLNVARINIQYKGKLTGFRFNIESTPDFIFFRLGKLYRYKIKEYTPTAFISFATDEYKKTKFEDVPPEYKEPIYKKLMEIANKNLQHSFAYHIIGVIAGIILFAVILLRLRKKKVESGKKTKKEK